MSFTFSEDEVRAAAPEVGRWIEARLPPALGSRPGSAAKPSTPELGTLADAYRKKWRKS